ncbi:hypothetical protein [Mycobacteroides abscessus]|uniref:hypothetical protein n=1 Tax=Mycobacteroides abscessus TaxID=36809 RepID=UPI0009A6824A|nr:hypothetical protein [Mycobacteroides abscessus]SKI75064.1 Uncharacterised protein [Mycobacteroides abscessus subsp. massiliense]SKM55944.1 Uncharacterised protein [Mycobacteroides abscessus subsp. massiliense]SKP98513.1 Uncharacterised protein [Mycobacteroides abscessus subsp. massiliense]SKQ07450.1 Uncharacterised protein [Mycobacteroides abscessus subsp. massiliense]SLL01574.1 Uncharacterised protein [Mycobacteroides abscessus subsp. massiliense]
MAYTRELKAVVPVLIGEHTEADDELLVWLVRESFEREAAAEYLTLTEWRDCGDLHPSEVSPTTEREVLKRPATDFRWRMFTGTATRSVDASIV